jgi:hypothetical protein
MMLEITPTIPRSYDFLVICFFEVFLMCPELAFGVVLFVSLAGVIPLLSVSAARNHTVCYTIRKSVTDSWSPGNTLPGYLFDQ